MRLAYRKGFTLIELIITVAIVALLATVAMPLTSLTLQRTKEQELHYALQQIRDAIDSYRKAVEEKHIKAASDESGYPKSLDILVEGAEDELSPIKSKIYFLRRIPRDPFSSDSKATAEATWGKRSYKSSAEDPQEGEDVFDIYSLAAGKGLNGIPYKEW